MGDGGGPTLPPALADAALALLGRAWGRTPRLLSVQAATSRETVFHLQLDDAPVAGVYLKRRRLTGKPEEAHAAFLQEWAGLQFLGELGSGEALAPRFYGGDADHAFLLLGDLGTGETLVEPLLGNDPARAGRALTDFFSSLGRLNGLTHAHRPVYDAVCRSLDLPPSADHYHHRHATTLLRRQLKRACRAAGVTPAPGAMEELADVATLRDPAAEWTGYSQVDVCPDNARWQPDRGRFVFYDFEQGGFLSIGSDAARARGNFPTCWCANLLPAATSAGCERAFRAALEDAAGPIDDDVFTTAIARAVAYWPLHMLRHYGDGWEKDSEWGIATVRQRIRVRFAILAATSAATGRLPALGETSRRIGDALTARWGDVPPMPLYPAFRD